jgi:hypothetical protein
MSENAWTGKQHHDDCPHCKKKLVRHSPNGFDVIYECPAEEGMHHRHMIRGITGEYVTLRPLSKAELVRLAKLPMP